MTQQEFAQKIKQKYPQYQAVDDATLVTRMLNKYPQYKDQIDEKSLGGFVNNLGSSAVQNAKDIGSALINVFNPNMEENTVANMGRLGAGTLQYLDPTKDNNISNFAVRAGQLMLNPAGTIRDWNQWTNYEPVAGAVGNFYKDRYGSPEAIGNALYNDPVGVALDASTLFSAGSGLLKGGESLANATGKVGTASKLSKASNIAGKAAEFTDPINVLSKPGSKMFSKIKIGDRVSDLGTDLRIRSAGITSPQARDFEKATGKNIRDFMKQEGLAGRGTSQVSPILDDVSKQYNQLARSGKKIGSGEVLKIFDNIIDRYSKEPLKTSQEIKILESIKKERDLIRSQVKIPQQPKNPRIQGVEVVEQPSLFSSRPSEYFKNVVEGEQSYLVPYNMTEPQMAIDNLANLKSKYFEQSRKNRMSAPTTASFQEDVAQSARNVLETNAPGLKKIGNRQQQLMNYEKIAKANAEKGKTGNIVKLPTLGAGTIGGLYAGVPGALGGMLLESVVNNPRTHAMAANALENLGKTKLPSKIAQPTYQTGRAMSRLDIGTPQQPQQPTTKPFTPKPTMPNTPVFKKKQNIKMPSLNLAPY